MYISSELKEKIDAVTNLFFYLGDYIDYSKPQKGNIVKGRCPICGESTLQYNKKKGMVSCFKCDLHANSVVSFLMKFNALSYPEACEKVCKDFGIDTGKEKPSKLNKPAKNTATNTSFKNRQLEESGLTAKDVKAIEFIPEENKQKEIDVFTSETISSNNRLITGDDMVIHYLDLDGKRIHYTVKNEKLEREFYRVRWQFPESHLDFSGKPKKYQSPYGSGITLYVPEAIRRMYRENHHTQRLFFTEGEKKAEKMCKHGYPAFGMPGINALVGKDKSFPESVTRFLERCEVKEVFFVLDSDFRSLSNNLKEDKDISERSRMFFYAAKNFKDWFRTLANRGLFPELYLIGGKGEHKGVDDQLTKALVGNESRYGEELKNSINAIAESNDNELFEIYKITQISDSKLAEIWNLNNKEEFCLPHRERLSQMEQFTFGKNKWKYNDAGDIEPAQPIMDDERFIIFKEIKRRGGNTERELKFDYVNMINFLKNRGFFRLRTPDYSLKFCRIENNIIKIIEPIEIRDFIMEFSAEVYDHEVQDKLMCGGMQFFGPDKLSYLPYFEPNKTKPEKHYEYLFFENKAWKISADGIDIKNISEISENIFFDNINRNSPVRTENLISVNRTIDKDMAGGYFYDITFSENANKSDFINYLRVVSKLNWTKHFDENRQLNNSPISKIDFNENNLQFISKMTAIGYMLHKYRDKNSEKAIIAMDAKISEVGEANGRSGKSIMGFAIGYIRNQAYIDAKRSGMEQDKFLWQEVTKSTESIFIDDVRVNFDFDLIYNAVVGMLTIEPKSEKKFTLREHDVPKIYLTTNHAINGATGSYKDRQFKIAFSDFFDEEYKPYEFFGRCLFTEWDNEQWNLFYNFMAECLQVYFIALKNGWGVNHSGLIAAPCLSIERRQLRQEMGENFFQYMCDVLMIDENNYDIKDCRCNTQLIRTELQENFILKYPREKNYYTAQKFWKRIVAFCRYFGFRLNPKQTRDPNYPEHDKSGGVENITIANKYFDI